MSEQRVPTPEELGITDEAVARARELEHKVLYAPETMTNAEKLEWYGKDGLVQEELVPVVRVGSLADEHGNTISFDGELYRDESAIPTDKLKGYKYISYVGGNGQMYGRVTPEGRVDLPQDWDDVKETTRDVLSWCEKTAAEVDSRPGDDYTQKLREYKQDVLQQARATGSTPAGQ